MRNYLGLALAAGLLLFPSSETFADGVIWSVSSAHDLVSEQAQSAWIEWSDGKERLTVAVKPGDVSAKMAWILPVPASAKQSRLKLVDKLPKWNGSEVRAEASLAFHPIMIVFYFLFFLLFLGGAGVGAITLSIIFIFGAISIGPGPGVDRQEDISVKSFAHVELGGLVSELVEVPSLDALKNYLKTKSCELPAPAAGMINEHIKKGHSFVISWAKGSKIKKALAVEVIFPSPSPWYPVRLTSAYGKARLEIDLYISGWQNLVSAQKNIRTGYYSSKRNPGKYTRILFSGRAVNLSEDWTFAPRKGTISLSLADIVAVSPFLANVVFLLLCSIAGAFFVGFIAFSDWRNRGGIVPLLKVGLAGIVPFIGPAAVLRKLRQPSTAEYPVSEPLASAVEPPPAISASTEHGLKYLWGIALICVGIGIHIWAMGYFSYHSYSGEMIGVIGSVVRMIGAGLFQFYRGHSWKYVAAGAFVAILPFFGSFLAIILRPGPTVKVKIKHKPFRNKAGMMSLVSLLLYLFCGAWLVSFWHVDIDKATVIIKSGGGFGNLIVKSKEGATVAALAKIRIAIMDYYNDTGKFPETLDFLIPKYLPSIPEAQLPGYHEDSSRVLYLTGKQYEDDGLSDVGGWVYVINGPLEGTVLVNCLHVRGRGKRWDSY